MTKSVKRTALALFLGAAIVATPAIASASSGGDPGARLKVACARVPNIIERTDKATTRLEGDATVKGSLLWLQAQIDKATAAHRTDLASVLQNRLTVRTDKLALLHDRSTALANIKSICAEHGL